MIMKSIKELKLVDVKIVIFGAGDFGSIMETEKVKIGRT